MIRQAKQAARRGIFALAIGILTPWARAIGFDGGNLSAVSAKDVLMNLTDSRPPIAPHNPAETPINPTKETWTYIDIEAFDALWPGQIAGAAQKPTLDDALQQGLPPETAPHVNYVLLADAYLSTVSAYGYMTPAESGNAAKSGIIEFPHLGMDSPQTYSAFFDWAVKNFPADHYVLSYFGHGGGPLQPNGAIGYDASDGDKGLKVGEFADVLQDLSSKIGKKISVVYLCTCVNGAVENAYAIRNTADMYVAGETSVGCSMETPFEILSDKQGQAMSSVDLANATVKSFNGVYDGADVVYSSVRLDSMHELADRVKRFGKALTRYASQDAGHAQQILNSAVKADNMNPQSLFYPYSLYLDLYGLADHLSADIADPEVQGTAKQVQQWLQDKVVTSLSVYHPVGTNANSHGLSIVHPTSQLSRLDLTDYKTLQFSVDTGWADYIQSLSPQGISFRIISAPPLAPTLNPAVGNPRLK